MVRRGSGTDIEPQSRSLWRVSLSVVQMTRTGCSSPRWFIVISKGRASFTGIVRKNPKWLGMALARDEMVSFSARIPPWSSRRKRDSLFNIRSRTWLVDEALPAMKSSTDSVGVSMHSDPAKPVRCSLSLQEAQAVAIRTSNLDLARTFRARKC
jgi:hypothetical protein